MNFTSAGLPAEINRWRGVRWWICFFLFSATVLCYLDRGFIGFLKSDLQHDLNWSENDYATVVAVFSLAYAFGQLLSGRLIDRIGVRLGFALAVGLWSLAAMGHALAWTVLGFGTARFCLGLAEGGNFPASIKAVSEWFPKKERAFATGLFNAGCNIGSILTPILVTCITVRLGWSWRVCFLTTGTAGLVWLVPWLLFYRSPEKHRRLSAAELAHIRADPPDPQAKISWLKLLEFRATWAFVIGISLTSPVWWFYLYWMPDFLTKSFHLNIQQMQLPVIVVYVAADLGSIGGGWLSSNLIRRGRSVNFGRKVAMLVCAACAVPVFFAPRASGMWAATALVALAAAAHQGYAANLYTMVSDTMPRFAVSSIVGIGGLIAGLVAMAFQKFSGYLLQDHPRNSYLILFGMCSCVYLIAVLCIQLLVPRLQEDREFRQEGT